MSTYLALLRGVNVGGKALLKMTDLTAVLTAAGFERVTTYIQSGNVVFMTNETTKKMIADHLQATIKQAFNLDVAVALFTAEEWQAIIAAAPDWWGQDTDWKHNLLVLTEATPMLEVTRAVGELKPAIEHMQAGDGVLYQSMSRALLGRTTTGKLASSPVYKKMTIRNYNTVTKLLQLLTPPTAR